MRNSDYINSYIKECNKEVKELSHPTWLRNFFETFGSSLEINARDASPGNRYLVTSAFAKAINFLVPEKLSITSEVSMGEFINLGKSSSLEMLLNKKRIDFVVEGDHSSIFIEFKTNLNFNDLAAAMVEMAVLKKFIHIAKKSHIYTCSLHLFPYRANIAGLRELNESLGSPLDEIWVLCTGPELRFDINTIKRFRKSLSDTEQGKFN